MTKDSTYLALLALLASLFWAGCAPDIRALEIRGAVSQGGEQLRSGDTVEAGVPIEVKRGRATLEVADRSTVRVFDGTRISVGGSNSSIAVQLLIGKVWAAVTPESGSFEVETSSAVAGVRGTEFIVETDEDETEVRVMEGEVEFASRADRGNKQRVKANRRSKTRKGKALGEPSSYDPATDRNVWKRLGSVFREIGEIGKDVAEGIRDGAKEAAPKIKQDLKEGGKALKRDLKKIFKK